MINNFLSILIIAKNEQENIGRCVDSVLKSVNDINDAEILLIDGGSTDKTVEIAENFPIRIIQIKNACRHTASAGRYLGTLNTNGEYIFIIDGDMELDPGFLKPAIAFLKENHQASAVAGIGREIHTENGKQVEVIDNLYKRNTVLTEKVDYLGGAALYRRADLEDAGGFNPYLFSQEELELCQRLLGRNKSIFSLPLPMIVHYTQPYKSIKLFIRHLNSNRFTGMGQVLRLSFGNRFFLRNAVKYKKFIIGASFLGAAGLILLAALFQNNIYTLIIIGFVLAAVFAVLAALKKSLNKAAVSFSVWPLIVFNFIKGFFLIPRPIHTYPREVKIIKGEKI